ncbi:FMN-dependent NADH-azoreductase [Agrobacterium sp. SHOUNA12C]|uniref:FMN dependent NADH:quinone oxidoreductase n=2 Tax=Rhizobium rhizogenes TaxID=359 RepID=B9JEC8_RHIR8|nr:MULTISPECIES: FMN-dependent NADH-azoreductase [Rhizobium]ACM26349.1 (acyl-carrier-protein) phosphodiesterase protein [Rhizobium rhizogenes K84]KAA6490813.1 FMN-dependent NADH-azoreductase [Agrobacterium sp. ICMP 7243]MCJ9725525.1 FMN-dependent NADH-azoreductase [Agrobacterium sp. BETTINA12B]MCJ9761373.1 FMN-dependent NADH-azoreductase [Agrobacterium sp. SHOUNA12C]OCJ25442.1 FMN-dependent NADH-azoreductase [Agrobacterium sp. B131/95]OCJ31411.1 FMN-dependent NADH-azoreductase [Agrobacterium 
MSSILLLTSSPRADSLSTKIATELADKIKAQNPGKTIVHRDLSSAPLPHIDELFTGAIRTPADARTAEQAEAVKVSDALVDELLAADTLVIGTGLINFNIYSSLKTWIDNIARAGRTFTYTETGPKGLATGKKAYIVLASGGVYSEGPAAPLNHAVPYLKSVLGFIGITDVETVYIEGIAFGPEAAEKAIGAAQARAAELALAA